MAEEDKKEEEIGSFYMGRRPPQPPKRILPPGVLTLFALAALGGIIWYAYPRGAERYTNLDVPVVKADTAPIKEKPASPGGMEVSHQDSTAFDPLQKNGAAEAEKLTPAPEQPMDKSEAIKPIASSPNLPPKLDMQVKPAANGAEEIIPKAAEVKPAPVAQPPIAQSVAAQPPVVKPTPKPEPVKMADAAPTQQPQPEAKPKSLTKKETPKKETAKEAKPREEKATAGTQYEVQLGSYREQDEAKKDWQRLQKKYGGQLSGLKMRLVKADIPGKGVYYRMRAGVVSKDKAHDICDALKDAHGVGCILAKR
jgi:hypothetical protein